MGRPAGRRLRLPIRPARFGPGRAGGPGPCRARPPKLGWAAADSARPCGRVGPLRTAADAHRFAPARHGPPRPLLDRFSAAFWPAFWPLFWPLFLPLCDRSPARGQSCGLVVGVKPECIDQYGRLSNLTTWSNLAGLTAVKFGCVDRGQIRLRWLRTNSAGLTAVEFGWADCGQIWLGWLQSIRLG